MRAFCRHANQNVSRRHADQSLPCRRQALEITKAHGLKVFLEMHGGTIHPSASLAYRIVSNFEPQDIGVICEPSRCSLPHLRSSLSLPAQRLFPIF